MYAGTHTNQAHTMDSNNNNYKDVSGINLSPYCLTSAVSLRVNSREQETRELWSAGLLLEHVHTAYCSFAQGAWVELAGTRELLFPFVLTLAVEL